MSTKEPNPFLDFLRAIYDAWVTERPGQMAATLAYFGLFSFAPLIFLAFSFASLVLRQMTIYSQFIDRLESTLGADAAKVIQDAVLALAEKTLGGSAIVTIISFLALLFAASGMFFQIQFSLNKIFQAPAVERGQTKAFIGQRLFSFLMVLGLGLLVIVASLLNFVINWLGNLFNQIIGNEEIQFPFESLAFFGLITLSYTIIYRVLPNVHHAWRDILPGAAIAALMTLLAGFILGIYFQFAGVGSAFEAAGTFAVILIAFNVIAQIFLFGALFTREYARRQGSLE